MAKRGAPAESVDTPADSLPVDSKPLADTSSSGAGRLELLEPLPDSAPRAAEVEQALGVGGGVISDAPSQMADSAPQPAPASTASPNGKPFERWTNSRLKNATRKALGERIKELETIAADKPAAPASDAAPSVTLEELERIAATSLAATLGVVSNIGARLRGEHWKLTDQERGTLAGAWAPVLAPYLGSLAGYLPVVAAVAVTADIVWPRIEKDMMLAKAASAEPLAVSVTPASSPDAP